VYRRRYESRRSSKPKCHFKKYGEKRFLIWRMEFLHPAMWHDHDIDFARWLHPAMWHLALGTWQWIHQVAAPCNVIRGSGMTCHWIAQTSVILECYIWFRFRPYHRSRHVILHQSAKFYPNRTTLGRKKWRHVDFQDGGSQPSWILQSNNGFFEKPMYDFLYVVNRHHSSKLLSSWENRVFFILATDKQTNRWTALMH